MPLKADLQMLVKVPEARRVFAAVLRQGNVLAPSYVSGDSLATAYNEGLRMMGLWFLNQLEAAEPGAGLRLLDEKVDA